MERMLYVIPEIRIVLIRKETNKEAYIRDIFRIEIKKKAAFTIDGKEIIIQEIESRDFTTSTAFKDVLDWIDETLRSPTFSQTNIEYANKIAEALKQKQLPVTMTVEEAEDY